jgi:ribosomal peptide maturation radical SAM protein 1
MPAIPGVLRRDPPPAPVPTVQIGARSAAAAPSCGTGAERETGLPMLPLDYDDFVRELAAQPFPAEMVLCFETSIGCWWGQKSHCTFCGLNSNSMEYRALEADDAVSLIQGLVDRYGDVCKSFEAVDNILSHRYFADVLPRLRMPDDVSLFYEVKANLSEAQVRQLAEARVTRIQPGMESISTEALKLLRKGVDAARNVTLLRNCRANDIFVDWNLLVAIPGESPAMYEQILGAAPHLVHLQPPAGAFEIRFDRYSPYFKDPAQFGVELAPFRFYSYLYPFGEPWLSRLAYFFESATGPRGGDETRVCIAGVREMINGWRARWEEAQPPVLEFDQWATVPAVVDTREPGHPRTYTLDAAEEVTLEFLQRPRSLAQVQQHLAERGMPTEVVELLCARRWLFEEGTHLVSVVVDRRRSPSVFLAAA